MIEAYDNLMASGAGELSLNTLSLVEIRITMCVTGECSEAPKRNDGMLLCLKLEHIDDGLHETQIDCE